MADQPKERPQVETQFKQTQKAQRAAEGEQAKSTPARAAGGE